jgi:serine/threonine protein phosphatase PrpC
VVPHVQEPFPTGPLGGQARHPGCSRRERHSTFRLAESPLTQPRVPHHSIVVGLTDVGRTRSRNEDSLSLLPDLGVAVVADGMGGHPGGDVASRIAADTASRLLEQALAARAGEASAPLGEAMRRSVLEAHEAIRAEGRGKPDLEGMGTTLTAFASDPGSGSFVVGHVGDSRAYCFRGGTLTQLTRDDTWVQERVDANQISVEQARRHPFAHLLTQCLGLEEVPVPHIIHGTVQAGDVYLLCTDGLVGMIEDDTLRDILSEGLGTNGGTTSDPHRVLEVLVDAANDAGGHDNITAALVAITSPHDG